MRVDPRGGHNHNFFNKNFFKEWSPEMSYALGFAFADGCLLDARKSSRCCYLKLCNNDLDLLLQIRRVMRSEHRIETRKARWTEIHGKKYFCKQSHVLKIGGKALFQDLINLGLRPDKSLVMKFPGVPTEFFNYFVRGYFDGDGCINSYQQKDHILKSIQVIFVSGSTSFLQTLSNMLDQELRVTEHNLLKNSGAFRLAYKSNQALKILEYMYQNLENAPYLNYKYLKYQEYLRSQRV